MRETSARLLALLSLLQVRREWSGADLAERLEVGPRTIRRDVEKLRGLGYPVQSARGVAGGYRLGTGSRLPPLLLDDGEAVAVAVGLRMAAAGSGDGESAVRALAKIEQLMPERLRTRARAVASLSTTGGLGAAPLDPNVLASLAVAAREQLRVEFRYSSANGVETARRVGPLALVQGGIDWYLVALDLDAQDWRLFRVDRIDTVRSGDRVRIPELPGGDPVAFVQSRAGGSHGTAVEPGRILVRAPAAGVRRRLPESFAAVDPDGDGCIVTSRGPWSIALLFRVLTLDAPFRVLGPDGLITAAARLRERLSD
jgi:predicted DNA-binding transcriptional regulator YafY